MKSVARPGGRTAKAEADDAQATEGHAARQALRREAERLALRVAGERKMSASLASVLAGSVRSPSR